MKKFIIIFLITGCLSSCLGSKKLVESDSRIKDIEKTTEKTDSSNVTTINKGIDDKVVTSVSASGDELIDYKIDEILTKLNTQKSSGSNNYTLSYDRIKREVIAELSVGQTQDTEIKTDTDKAVEKTYEEVVSERVKKTIKLIPWYVWLIVAFVFRRQIIGFIAVFYPPIKGITTVRDLFTPPDTSSNK